MPRPRREDKAIEVLLSVCVTEDDLSALEKILETKRARTSKKIGRSTLLREALRQYLANEQLAA